MQNLWTLELCNRPQTSTKILFHKKSPTQHFIKRTLMATLAFSQNLPLTKLYPLQSFKVLVGFARKNAFEWIFFLWRIKPYLFAHQNPINSILVGSLVGSLVRKSYHSKQKDGYSLPINDPTNNRNDWIWMSKKIRLNSKNILWSS